MALRSDWSWVIADALLTAAVSCEAVCDRRFVSDGSRVESPPPGCQCQLVAVVTEGLAEVGGVSMLAGCGSSHTATIRLILDLCTESPPGPDAVPDPVAINTRAQANASTRWLILQGIANAAALGLLTVDTEDPPMPAILARSWRIGFDQWRSTWTVGGMARWELVLTFAAEGESPPGPFGS